LPYVSWWTTFCKNNKTNQKNTNFLTLGFGPSQSTPYSGFIYYLNYIFKTKTIYFIKTYPIKNKLVDNMEMDWMKIIGYILYAIGIVGGVQQVIKKNILLSMVAIVVIIIGSILLGMKDDKDK
jgi:hypothetical protein